MYFCLKKLRITQILRLYTKCDRIENLETSKIYLPENLEKQLKNGERNLENL